MYELIIVGGGPAAMTAAVYAARKKIDALMLTENIGGQVMWTSAIENYMGYQMVEGFELIDKFEQQLKQFTIDRREGEEVIKVQKREDEFEVITRSGNQFSSKTVLVATGKMPRRLGVPGEDALIGRGVSYCAVCDAPVFSGLKVAVVGGGNSALEALDDLLKIADRVYSISEMGFTGDGVLVDRIKNDSKLVVYPRHRVTGIKGTDMVESVTFKDLQTSETITLDVKGIFVEIGLIPNSELVKGLADLNANGEIKVDCRAATSVPGLFAAGDVTDAPEKQIIIAAGEGAKAALQAHRYLQRQK